MLINLIVVLKGIIKVVRYGTEDKLAFTLASILMLFFGL